VTLVDILKGNFLLFEFCLKKQKK